MRILPRYMLRHFFPVFGLSLFAFSGLYFIVDFFEKIDNMMERNLPFEEISSYFLWKIPFVVTQGIPLCTLLAALITLGLLKKNRELIAMEAAGINPLFYAIPIALAALALSFAHFAIAEFAARPLIQKTNEIWELRVKQNRQSVWWNPENIWYRGENTIYQIRLYDRQHQTLEKVSIFFLDPQFRLTKRIDAKRLVWKNPGWTGEDGLIIGLESQQPEQEWFAKKELDLPLTPKDLSRMQTIPEEMPWLDLYQYADKLEQEGLRVTPYLVELNRRIADPLTAFVLAILGLTVAFRQELHGGIAAGVGIALGVAALFIIVSALGSALASVGVLPPFLGVWAGNILFLCLASYSWMRERR
jgi:lipopolysaccharide export system permease protein